MHVSLCSVFPPESWSAYLPNKGNSLLYLQFFTLCDILKWSFEKGSPLLCKRFTGNSRTIGNRSMPYWTDLETTRQWRTPGDHFNVQWCPAGLRDRPTFFFSFSWTTSRMTSKLSVISCYPRCFFRHLYVRWIVQESPIYHRVEESLLYQNPLSVNSAKFSFSRYTT